MPIQKIPPPPPLPRELQPLNRWLLEFQSIINASGVINTDDVENLPETITQVGDNTADIVTLFSNVNLLNLQVAVNTANITALQLALAALTAAVTALTTRVNNLEARGEVLYGNGAPGAGLGKVSDWYADIVGGNIYVKTAVATWTFIV